jgi:putative redox protein
VSDVMEVLVEQIGPTTSRGTARSHTVLVDRPLAKEGADQGPLGGELLLLSLGGCFMSNLLAAGRARSAPLDGARVTVSGTIDGTPARFSSITLRLRASGDVELLRKLGTIAERACLVTNTLRPAVSVSVVVEDGAGEP